MLRLSARAVYFSCSVRAVYMTYLVNLPLTRKSAARREIENGDIRLHIRLHVSCSKQCNPVDNGSVVLAFVLFILWF